MVYENSLKKIIYIIGPTASGKTDLAINLCKHLNGEILGADSMQIYKYICIGTAKPTQNETGGCKYHFIDFVEPDEIYTVSQYKDDALNKINLLHNNGITPIICGGTGLYINALLYEMDFSNASYSLSLREKLNAMSENDLLDTLRQMDEKTYSTIDKANRRRVLRAVEICMLSDIPKSQQITDYKQNIRPYDHRVFILNPDRKLLYDRINNRVDIMIANGLENEVKMLLNLYPDEKYPIFQFIGYKEMAEYINGVTDKETAIENMKRNTRRFAKRQLTWFRGITGIKHLHWLDTSLGRDILTERIMELSK